MIPISLSLLFSSIIWISLHPAPNIFLTAYYFIGLSGFFFLAQHLYLNARLSLLATALLMFSSLGIVIFQHLSILYLFTPSAWFFFFTLSFTQQPQKKALLGMTLTFLIIMMTPLPLHFLTILFSFIFFSSLFYWRERRKIFSPWRAFFKLNKWSVFISLVGFLISFLILFFKKYPIISIEVIQATSIAQEILWMEIFPNLDLGTHPFAYIPIFLYLLLPLSIINKNHARQSVLFFTTLLVFLIALTNVTPLHAFLYRYIYLFKFFQHYHYFLPLLLPFFILFCVEQLKLLLKHTPRDTQEKIFLLLFLTIIHVTFGLFIHHQENILWSSYATVIGSYFFFMFYFTAHPCTKNIAFTYSLILIALIQPVEVNYHLLKILTTS